MANGNNDIFYAVDEGIATVTINRPNARNALTFAMYERLAALCQEIDGDDAIKAVVVTGAGDKAFAAGTDISEFRAFRSGQDAIRYEKSVEVTLSAIERLRVPTIAAIRGVCTGGGAAIAGCCDLRVAARDVKIGYPVARTLGNCISLTNYARFSALIGAARVKDIIFRARLIEADEALSIGLVTELVDDPTQLVARALGMARTVAGNAPLTIRATKEALLRLRPSFPEGADDDLVLMCYESDDFKEGMDAFLNKRSPKWRGR